MEYEHDLLPIRSVKHSQQLVSLTLDHLQIVRYPGQIRGHIPPLFRFDLVLQVAHLAHCGARFLHEAHQLPAVGVQSHHEFVGVFRVFVALRILCARV